MSVCCRWLHTKPPAPPLVRALEGGVAHPVPILPCSCKSLEELQLSEHKLTEKEAQQIVKLALKVPQLPRP